MNGHRCALTASAAGRIRGKRVNDKPIQQATLTDRGHESIGSNPRSSCHRVPNQRREIQVHRSFVISIRVDARPRAAGAARRFTASMPAGQDRDAEDDPGPTHASPTGCTLARVIDASRPDSGDHVDHAPSEQVAVAGVVNIDVEGGRLDAMLDESGRGIGQELEHEGRLRRRHR